MIKDFKLKYGSPGQPNYFCIIFKIGVYPQFQLFTISPNRFIPFALNDAKRLKAWLEDAIPIMEINHDYSQGRFKDMNRKFLSPKSRKRDNPS